MYEVGVLQRRGNRGLDKRGLAISLRCRPLEKHHLHRDVLLVQSASIHHPIRSPTDLFLHDQLFPLNLSGKQLNP